MDGDSQLLIELDGAIIRYLAAAHASFVASYEHPDADDPTTDLLYRCTIELRDAAATVIEKCPR